MTGSLDLAPGAALMLDGQGWTVERAEPQFGRVVLLDVDGRRFPTTMRFLMNHPDCRASSTAGEVAAGRGRQQPTLADLNEHQRTVVNLRLAHLLEAETGFRGGDPLRPGPGEPRPEFDPSVTTLTQRRLAKAAELAAMDREQARLLGLDKAGYRTLIRWAARRRQVGAVGCADDRWLRPGGGYPSVNELVREAIFAVHARCGGRGGLGQKTAGVARRMLACRPHRVGMWKILSR